MPTFQCLILIGSTVALLLLPPINSLALQTPPRLSRRDALASAFAVASASVITVSSPAFAAATDCYTDCFNNCKSIAPKNVDYCQMTCQDYCSQDDRADGLSGSVSTTGGEVGILGGTFGTGTVVKGQDKPPDVKIPGLDFLSGKGKQLIGY